MPVSALVLWNITENYYSCASLCKRASLLLERHKMADLYHSLVYRHPCSAEQTRWPSSRSRTFLLFYPPLQSFLNISHLPPSCFQPPTGNITIHDAATTCSPSTILPTTSLLNVPLTTSYQLTGRFNQDGSTEYWVRG